VNPAANAPAASVVTASALVNAAPAPPEGWREWHGPAPAQPIGTWHYNPWVVATLSVFAGCTGVLMLFSGCSRIARLSERAARLAVPLVVVLSLWVGRSMASSVIESAIENSIKSTSSNSDGGWNLNLGFTHDDR